MTRSLLLSDSCGFVILGRPLWREDGSVVYNSCWPSPAQSFSGPSPVRRVAIFYCLRFETSLFVSSYDLQAHGGGIQPRLHTELATSGLALYTYSQRTDQPTENTASIVACWNLFSEPLPGNDHVLFMRLNEVFIAPLPSYTRYNIYIYIYTWTCKRMICRCHYAISGFHSNEFRVITCCIKVIYIKSQKRVGIHLFQCIMPIRWLLIIFWCSYLKSIILHKGDGLQLHTRVCFIRGTLR
jgi:hypothetical protein